MLTMAMMRGAPPPLREPAPPASPRSARPAVFVDLDGTLIEPMPERADPTERRFLPGAGAALAALQRAGFALVIVTNQSGIARGCFSRAEFVRLQAALQQRLRVEPGIELDDFLVCPHAPGRDGAPACLCRKPAPGLLVRAARAHGLDLRRSWSVGDALDDIEAGHRAGCRGLLLDRDGVVLRPASPMRTPDAQCRHWDEINALILTTRDLESPAIPSAGVRVG